MPPAVPDSPHAPTLGRRTALASIGVGVVALPGLAACSSTPAATPAERRTVRSREVDPDVALAAQALAALDDAAARLRSVALAQPALRAAVDPARRLVESHRSLLLDAVPDDVRSPAPSASPSASASASAPGARAEARRRARAELRRLPALLTELSVRAASGAFAGLLAQMAAAYAQAGYVLDGRRA